MSSLTPACNAKDNSLKTPSLFENIDMLPVHNELTLNHAPLQHVTLSQLSVESDNNNLCTRNEDTVSQLCEKSDCTKVTSSTKERRLSKKSKKHATIKEAQKTIANCSELLEHWEGQLHFEV